MGRQLKSRMKQVDAKVEFKMKDRVGSRRLRTVTLPHHRTCRFQHPAVEPSGGQAARSDGNRKP